MNDVLNPAGKSYINDRVIRKLFLFCSVFIIILIPASLFLGNYKILVLLIGIPLIFLLFIYFDKFVVYYFIFSLFINFYFYGSPLNLQIINLVSYALIFFFIINKDSNLFNHFKLPSKIKITATLLIISVVASSILSPFISPRSLYFAYLFLTFIVTSYLIFRSIKDGDTTKNYIEFYLIANFICALIIIAQILFTSEIRSVGFSGFSYFGLVMNSFLIIFFRDLILGKPNLKHIFFILIFTVTIVANQSRFAWFGIIISIIYGLLICLKYEKDSVKFLKQKLFVISFLVIVGIVIIFSTGLSSIFSSRISELDINLFESDPGEQVISNSLETRVLIWTVAAKALLENPTTGVGYQMFPTISENYNFYPDIIYVLFIKDLDAHSTMVNILAETGIFGFVCFVLYISVICKYSFKAIKIAEDNADRKISIVLNILLFLLVSSCVYSGAYTFGQNAFEMHFLFGVTIGNYLVIKNKNDFKENNELKSR